MNTFVCANDSVCYRSAFESNAVPAAVAVKATSGCCPQTDISERCEAAVNLEQLRD